MIIAMDGPAGTGKGTISRLISQRLGFIYIDTGAMYRAITLKMLSEKIELDEIEKIQDLLNRTEIHFETQANSDVEQEVLQKVFLDGEDVTKEIRLPLVNEHVSPYSAVKIIREKMVDLQRRLAEGKDVIMEGRDITTVVFPNAELKIYLTASLEERAERRYKELIEKGVETTYEETLESIQKRDENDRNKEMGALKIAEDAIVVDTTGLTIEEVYQKIKEYIEEKRK